MSRRATPAPHPASPRIGAAAAWLLPAMLALGGQEALEPAAAASATPGSFARDHLLGDLLDTRTWLADRGVALELYYIAEYFWNVRGGVSTDDAGGYFGNGGAAVEVDTAAAGLWDDGLFRLFLEGGHGNGISEKYVGSFQTVSNIEADDFLQVSEFWYRHQFFDGGLWVKLGKQEANDDFESVEFTGEFVISTAAYCPTISLITYPDQYWGAVIGTAPVPWFSMNAGVYAGRPSGSRSIGHAFEELYGPFVIAEPVIHYQAGTLGGHVRAGGWYSGDDAVRLAADNPDPERLEETYGFYMSWDQELWKEHPDQADDLQGIGLFGRYGWSPPDRSEAEHFAVGGLEWTGLVPGRDLDIFGAGVFHVGLSDEAGFEEGSETAVEVFYRLQACGWLSLKPDVQYIFNPGGTTNDDAVVVGLRAEISL